MNERTEKQLKSLEQEIKALKTSFEQSASSMEIYTTRTTFTTQSNKFTATNPSYDYEYWSRIVGYYDKHSSSDPNSYYADEPVIVTFRSENGQNVLANLEIGANGDATSFLKITRVPFNGGARWKILCYPLLEDVGNPTQYVVRTPWNLDIAVQAGVRGTLEVKMAWQ